MNLKPVSIQSFPKAILHIDGDSFFASCEQAMDRSLVGRPLVTGKERGIASAVSKEAKARGIKRGMPIFEMKKLCPELLIVPSNYEAYSLYARRMYEIVRRYTPEVEEYSIDECFADITGMRRSLGMGYQAIAEAIKCDLETELGITFSFGLAPTKVLAKIGSKWNKPSGITIIPGKRAHEFLVQTPIEDVWGIGSQTACFLRKFRITNAYEYAMTREEWVAKNLSKPYRGIYEELRAVSVFPLDLEATKAPKSISKTKTFTPASSDRNFVFSELSKNIENACIKARRHGLYSNTFAVYIKTQDFRFRGVEFTLSQGVNTPSLVVGKASQMFDRIFDPSLSYRGTGVVMKNLEYASGQKDLFGDSARIEKYSRVFASVDEMRKKYGKHTLFLGSSFETQRGRRVNHRSVRPDRNTNLLRGETKRVRVDIPWLGMVE